MYLSSQPASIILDNNSIKQQIHSECIALSLRIRFLLTLVSFLLPNESVCSYSPNANVVDSIRYEYEEVLGTTAFKFFENSF